MTFQTENGWQSCGPDRLNRSAVPGTNVVIPLQVGQPTIIMKAFAADYHRYVEPLRQGDCGGWTATNSVATSNHLGGTAMDLNWNSHPFHKKGTFNAGQMATLREMLAFYEDTIWWGGDWENPIDEMHWQMGYDTYGAENVDRVQNFINRRIHIDGFSSFRSGGPPPPPPPMSQPDRHALEVIAEGRRRGVTPRGIQIALSVTLVESNLKMYANSNVPESMTRPHDAVGSDHDSVGLFQQRYPMWGSLDCLMNAACSAGLFYDRLAKMNYNDSNRSPGSFAADIQRPAAQYRGRYDERFGEAVNLYNRLSQITVPGEDDFLSELSAAEQRGLYNAIMNQRASRSPLRHLGEGTVGDTPDQVWDMDGSIHILVVYLLASLGHPGQLALLNEVASADPVRYPDRQSDKVLAQAILAELGSARQSVPASVSTSVLAPRTVVAEPEVLPALVQDVPARQEQVDQVDSVIGALALLRRFDKKYREMFDELTDGDKK